MLSIPWNSIHLKKGDGKPAVDPEKVVIYAMRLYVQHGFIELTFCLRFCPYAERAILTSLEKGLDFAVVNINLTSKPDWFLEMNPSGSIPVVEYKGGIVTGSVEASVFIDQVKHLNTYV
jgi:glutaredoxin